MLSHVAPHVKVSSAYLNPKWIWFQCLCSAVHRSQQGRDWSRDWRTL